MSDSERCCSLLKTCWHRTETSSLELLVGLRKCWKAHSLLLLAPCTCWTLLVRENSSHIAENEWKSPILFFFFWEDFQRGVGSPPSLYHTWVGIVPHFAESLNLGKEVVSGKCLLFLSFPLFIWFSLVSWAADQYTWKQSKPACP